MSNFIPTQDTYDRNTISSNQEFCTNNSSATQDLYDRNTFSNNQEFVTNNSSATQDTYDRNTFSSNQEFGTNNSSATQDTYDRNTFSSNQEFDTNNSSATQDTYDRNTFSSNQEFVANNSSANDKKELCGDFQRGRCHRGDRCKYSHQYRDGQAPARVERGDDARQERRDFSREECRDFSRGRCERGHNCRYMHPAAPSGHRDPSPRFSGYGGSDGNTRSYGSQSQSSYNCPPRNYYDSPPRNYYDNAPRHSDSYYTPNNFERRESGRMKNYLCRDFISGRCTRGSECRYKHEDHTGGKVERCLDFTRGDCNRGDRCRYSHDENVQVEVCRDFLADRCKRGQDCKYRHDEAELAKKRKFAGPTSETSRFPGAQRGYNESGRPRKMMRQQNYFEPAY